MRKLFFLIFTTALFISVLFLGCQGAGVGNDIDGQAGTIDSSSIDGSPLAPDIVSGESGSDERALVSPEDQDFGPFVMIQNSAGNYNSITKVGVPQILDMMDGDPEIEEDPVEPVDVNVGNYVRVYKKDDKRHYENEDASETCTMSGDPEAEAECRQFDAFVIPEEEGYSYSRAIFFWPEGSEAGAGVDVTEVWEYADRKEVSVTMYRPGTPGHVNKYLAVTDMSDELEKTSLLEYSDPYTDADITITDYGAIGFIDLTMTAAAEDALASHTGAENTYLDGYPAFEKLEALHAKSVTPAEAKAVYIDPVDPEPFLGFEDRSELF